MKLFLFFLFFFFQTLDTYTHVNVFIRLQKVYRLRIKSNKPETVLMLLSLINLKKNIIKRYQLIKYAIIILQ